MDSFLLILAVGLFLGMRHATDADHVIAVSTIVSRQGDLRHAALTGLFWGFGHTLTILAVGTSILSLGLAIPARFGLGMELSVSLMLIVLGLGSLARFFRLAARIKTGDQSRPVVVHSHTHSHADYIHDHPHGHRPETHPHQADQTPLARMDRWLGRIELYQYLRPLLVGVVHGLAGSAAVALFVLAAIPNPRWAIAYLLVFGTGTMAGMMLITLALSSAFTFARQRNSRLSHWIGFASGVVSLAFGVWLAYRICFVDGLFTPLS